MRESDLTDELRRLARLDGAFLRKVNWEGRVNAPDWLLKRSVWKRPVFVELKAPGAKPNPGQVREFNEMRGQGMEIHVVDSMQSLWNLFQ